MRGNVRARFVGTGLLVVGLLIGLAVVGAVPAAAADVHGDDGRDVYVGTGGLILPPGVGEEARNTVARCPGCAWRLTTVCVDPGLGSPFDEGGGCAGVVRGCPQGRQLLRAWFRPAGEPWRAVDVVCLGEPVTVEEVGHEVADRVEEGIPDLRPAFQPLQGAVTQLPVAFSSGQPAGPRRWTMQVAGRSVSVTAVPSWTWSYGDGSTWTGSEPGGGFRRPTVTHAYARPGLMQVVVRTRWTATYVVDGLGPFDVAEPVSQSAAVDVRIGEGRAVLVPG